MGGVKKSSEVGRRLRKWGGKVSDVIKEEARLVGDCVQGRRLGKESSVNSKHEEVKAIGWWSGSGRGDPSTQEGKLVEGGAVSLTDCDHGKATGRKPLRRGVSLFTLGWKAGRNQQRGPGTQLQAFNTLKQ